MVSAQGDVLDSSVSVSRVVNCKKRCKSLYLSEALVISRDALDVMLSHWRIRDLFLHQLLHALRSLHRRLSSHGQVIDILEIVKSLVTTTHSILPGFLCSAAVTGPPNPCSALNVTQFLRPLLCHNVRTCSCPVDLCASSAFPLRLSPAKMNLEKMIGVSHVLLPEFGTWMSYAG